MRHPPSSPGPLASSLAGSVGGDHAGRLAGAFASGAPAGGQLVGGRVPSLENLRCFAAAARLPTFRAAARAVALTPAALSQRIRQLEDQLGVRLFERTTRSVSLTSAGLALLPAVATVFTSVEDCMRAARGEGAAAPVELTVGTRMELGLSFLLPSHDQVVAACPGFSLNYFFGSGSELLGRVRMRELDCAVTSSRFTDAALMGLPLHREDYVFVAERRLLRRQPLSRVEHAPAHTLLDVDASLPLFRYWREAAGRLGRLRFGRSWMVGAGAAMHGLILEGRGVGVLPAYLVAEDLRKGRLQTVFPSVTPHFDHFRLVFRSDDPRRGHFEKLAAALLALPLR
jgi:LysR family glycine cleavage system transcriptional activator